MRGLYGQPLFNQCDKCGARLIVEEVAREGNGDMRAYLRCPNRTIFSRGHSEADYASLDGGNKWLQNPFVRVPW